ncbi:hypothetical protein [Nocardia cyriacigeorgica]|uniref:hypothetical protein n=1 Tax=Nocardia cyriacigeorgica TaxID=135487 RepID=UPI0024554949|nr:hypothetical protein [Nocardia cyriacigeorgica]
MGSIGIGDGGWVGFGLGDGGFEVGDRAGGVVDHLFQVGDHRPHFGKVDPRPRAHRALLLVMTAYRVRPVC